MARIKDWMIEMEELTYRALEIGFTSFEDVYAYVNTHAVADSSYIHNILEQYHNGPDFKYRAE